MVISVLFSARVLRAPGEQEGDNALVVYAENWQKIGKSMQQIGKAMR
jgi:hypothetical protein